MKRFYLECLLGLLFCGSLWAQNYFFLPIKDDFVIYDITQRAVVHAFQYHHSDIKGVLWRPTEDLTYIFAKNTPTSSLLIRKESFGKRAEYFFYQEAFSDFQVVDSDHIVVRTLNNDLCLWTLSTGESLKLLSDFRDLYFHYNHAQQVLVTQSAECFITLHFLDKEKSEKLLDKIEDKSHFTVVQNRLTYLNGPHSWILYNLETGETQQYALFGYTNLCAVWPAGNQQFIVKQYTESEDCLEITGWKLLLYTENPFDLQELFTHLLPPLLDWAYLESNPLICALTNFNQALLKK